MNEEELSFLEEKLNKQKKELDYLNKKVDSLLIKAVKLPTDQSLFSSYLPHLAVLFCTITLLLILNNSV